MTRIPQWKFSSIRMYVVHCACMNMQYVQCALHRNQFKRVWADYLVHSRVILHGLFHMCVTDMHFAMSMLSICGGKVSFLMAREKSVKKQDHGIWTTFFERFSSERGSIMFERTTFVRSHEMRCNYSIQLAALFQFSFFINRSGSVHRVCITYTDHFH